MAISATPPEIKNIQAIMDMERENRDARSPLDRLTDGVSALAASPTFIVSHVAWFLLWIVANTIGRARFDPYPFNLLTLAVSLEAIVLTSFVLMAQSRMTQQADRRAHLDLQINLLAEQELTAILRLQCQIAEHAGLDVSAVEPRLDQLRSHTNVPRLAAALTTELASIDSAVDRAQNAGAAGPPSQERPPHDDFNNDSSPATRARTAPAARAAAGAETRSAADHSDSGHPA